MLLKPCCHTDSTSSLLLICLMMLPAVYQVYESFAQTKEHDAQSLAASEVADLILEVSHWPDR